MGTRKWKDEAGYDRALTREDRDKINYLEYLRSHGIVPSVDYSVLDERAKLVKIRELIDQAMSDFEFYCGFKFNDLPDYAHSKQAYADLLTAMQDDYRLATQRLNWISEQSPYGHDDPVYCPVHARRPGSQGKGHPSGPADVGRSHPGRPHRCFLPG